MSLRIGALLALLFIGSVALADSKDFPEKPAVINAVNDYAHVLSDNERAQLESKLRGFEQTTSNEIIVVTITDIGDYAVSDYATILGKNWGIGKAGKNNGIVVLAAINNHKINISTGKGLEGALTDLTCGRIIRNEITPAFRKGDYYEGFSKAADAIIAATKGEYKADAKKDVKNVSGTALIIIVIIIVLILKIMRRGGGGGGNYMSGGGAGNFLAGMLMSELLNGRRGGGWGGGSGGWGGGDSGGGFGGFGGGGDFGGGGASGSW